MRTPMTAEDIVVGIFHHLQAGRFRKVTFYAVSGHEVRTAGHSPVGCPGGVTE